MISVSQVPPVLIVHLKRFGGGAKISLPVVFPLVGLDLSDVVKSPQVSAGHQRTNMYHAKVLAQQYCLQ